MSIPKFTAEASVENYGNAYASRKYKHEYGTSMRIEPQIMDDMGCSDEVCSTERCSYICGFGPPIQWCEATREKCTANCCSYDPDTGYLYCTEYTFWNPTFCGDPPFP